MIINKIQEVVDVLWDEYFLKMNPSYIRALSPAKIREEITYLESIKNKEFRSMMVEDIENRVEWKTISELYSLKEDGIRNKRDILCIEFPMDERKSVSSWRKMLEEISHHLVDEITFNVFNKLQFLHSTEEQCRNPVLLSNGMYLDSHGSAYELICKSKSLIEEVGREPDDYFVKIIEI